jgi:riboflavin kinase
MASKTKLFVDIDLLLDFRGLQFCYARQYSKLSGSSIQILYGKSFQQGYSDLNLPYNFLHLKPYLPSIKPHIHSISVLKSLKQHIDLSLISFIESEIVEVCIDNCSDLQGIPILYTSHSDLLSTLSSSPVSTIYLSHLPSHQACRNADFSSVHISFPSREKAEDSYETLWSLHPIAEESYEFRYKLWSSSVSLSNSIALEGSIVKGFGRGSSELGFPTANLEVRKGEVDGLVPGIYAAKARLGRDGFEREYAAAVSVGWNPQYDNEMKTIEAHIIEKFEGNLYGEEMVLEFIHYLRAECAFSSFDELIQAIGLDVEVSKQLISTSN